VTIELHLGELNLDEPKLVEAKRVAPKGVDPQALGREQVRPILPSAKFADPDWTAKGERRASVALDRLQTLWINTGTLCNITCVSCYIESSPTNDRLAYITAAEAYLNEIRDLKLGTAEIGFTGGEPFMNPDMLAMARDALGRGLSVLILTNAMQPMQRPAIKKGLLSLKDQFGGRLQVRVSLDHHTQTVHEAERGKDTWQRALAGIGWLAAHGFNLAIAGRSRWQEDMEHARTGYGALFATRAWPISATNPAHLVMLPEMDETAPVPEITTQCWSILHKSPSEMMCASSRMVVKRRGADKPTVVPCTLLPYIEAFDMGTTLAQSAQADGGMFATGAVKLCHPHCAKFCVLGGGSCSG
jgi:hypothetical protein